MSTATVSAARPSDHRTRGRGRRALAVVAVLVGGLVALVGVLLFAPVAVGGPASYVVTQGTSMQPTYKAGGVIVTHTRDSYGVGDVVAYRNPQLGGTVVLHRIVAERDGRFTMQGDNNDFTDGYLPGADDVVGEAWLYAPGAGQVVEALRRPLVFGLIIAAVTLISFRAPRPTSRRRRLHHVA